MEVVCGYCVFEGGPDGWYYPQGKGAEFLAQIKEAKFFSVRD